MSYRFSYAVQEDDQYECKVRCQSCGGLYVELEQVYDGKYDLGIPFLCIACDPDAEERPFTVCLSSSTNLNT